MIGHHIDAFAIFTELRKVVDFRTLRKRREQPGFSSLCIGYRECACCVGSEIAIHNALVIRRPVVRFQIAPRGLRKESVSLCVEWIENAKVYTFGAGRA